VEANPVQRRIKKLFVTCLEPHHIERRFAHERLWISTVHRCFQKKHVIHRVIPCGSRPVIL
jgi:hypothetical protein